MSEIINIKNGDINIDVIKIGNGKRNFVMIPGLSIKPISLSADGIEAAYSQFKDTYTIYAFDINKDIKAGITIDKMASDIVYAINELGIKGAYIFGVSQGGMIAQRIAINNPELVNALLLASTTARCDEKANNTINKWVELAKEGNAKEINQNFSTMVYSKAFVEKYKDILDGMHKSITNDDLKVFVDQANACIGFDTYDDLDKIKAPTMVIGASEDMVFGERPSIDIMNKLNCEGYTYENQAHAVYDEAPDYKDRIQEFFDKH